MESISVEHLYKIFGPNPGKAKALLEQGKTKDEIMEKTGHGVGVADASFTVNKGEILVIMGLSGSGKSTLVRCINRLIEPTSGKVIVDGTDVTQLTRTQLRHFRQKHFGMVFQNFALLPHRNILKNVAYGLEIQKMDVKEREARAMEAIEQVGLSGWETSMPDQLSGGMQQRVGLARALALDAEILLMDEAFSALDPLIRRDMQDELISLQEKVKKTIVFISHDLDEALKLGDRIVLMKDGVIVQQGTAEDIMTNPANDYVTRFVEDVDMTKVLTAENVMQKNDTMAYYTSDGPKAALHKMKKVGISRIFVRKEGKLVGIVSAQDASAALKEGAKTLEGIIDTNIISVPPEASAAELFPLLSDNDFPVAVVNENEKMLGIVKKGSLIAALAEQGNR